MLIGIDATRAQKPNKTGVEWYAFHLIQELKKLTAGGPHSWVLYSREPLTGPLAELPENWYEVRAGWPPKWLWTQVRLSWEMLRRPVDVLFVPAHVLPPFRPEKSVVTVHDVGFRRFPQLYSRKGRAYHENTMRRVAKGHARIITVSEFSGREIAELYGVNTRRIALTPLGVDHELYRPVTDQTATNDLLQKYRLPPSFFLVLGWMGPKKNLVNTINAFNSFKTRRGVGDPTALVFAGPKGREYETIQKAMNASPYKQYIKEIGYVDEDEKPALLSAAKGLLYLSWYEGFGIPAIEAMACGCPVIAANNSSLPEVMGQGNGLYVSPKDPEAAARAMERLLTDNELRQSLVEKGPQHAARYTWRRTAEATLPVLTDWIGA